MIKFTIRVILFIVLSNIPLLASQTPNYKPSVSFQYNAAAVDLSTFQTHEFPVASTDQYDAQTVEYTASDGKLQVRLETKTYKRFPVFEYKIWLKNLSSSEPTGIVSDFRSFDASVALPQSDQDVVLDTIHGSRCQANDFIPERIVIPSGKERVFTTPSGRSSNDYIPFLDLSLSDNSGRIFAIGWTGAWEAKFVNAGESVTITAGMDRSHFKLLPGEEIRQPSIAVFVREGQTRRAFKTFVHQFMLENKVPRDANGAVIPPILAVASGGGNKTPKMMLDILNYCLDNKLPFDTYWIDAGWYGAPHEDELYSNCGPNWWKYVGDWRVNTTTHPTGDLLPIANAVHAANLKFLLWFEPERIMDNAPILQTHPKYRNGILFDYGNPEALSYMQKTIYEIIAKHKIDIFRQDFNMDPREVWVSMEKDPDRVGIAEARHITGLYKFLDDMRTQFPNILQENCASGGRRIDIEMIARAHVYCRSDYYIGQKPEDKAFILGQNATLNTLPFLPFQGCEFNCVPIGDDYGAFSIISSGTVITPSDFDGGIIRRDISASETAWFKKVFDKAAAMKPFFMGDFYPLTDECKAGNDLWCAWQANRADLNAGFAIAFRRADNKEGSQMFCLSGIDPNAEYSIETYEGQSSTAKGADLQSWTVSLAPRSFSLIFYKKR